VERISDFRERTLSIKPMAKKKTRSRTRYRSVTARSLPEFVNVVQGLQDDWSDLEAMQTERSEHHGRLAHVWFRGHANKDWELNPKIFRTNNEIEVEDEEELYAEFIRRGCSVAPSLSDGWHSYFVMQHHGVPTRLLDWTDSALVALYFALKNCEADAAVWAVNPLWLNGRTINSYSLVDPSVDPVAATFRVDALRTTLEGTKDEALPLLSIAVRPPWVSMRMFAQRSLFTLHGSRNIPIETYPFVRRTSPLCRIVIPLTEREDVMVGLRACGVTETTIFPDLDGLAKELIAEYGGLAGSNTVR
jgi:FRG domain